MMVPDHASRALGALPALHSWSQSRNGGGNHLQALLARPRGCEQWPLSPGVRWSPRFTCGSAAMRGDGSKRRAIANHVSGKELALWRMPMDRQLPNRRRPGGSHINLGGGYRISWAPLVSVPGKIRHVDGSAIADP